MAEEVIELSADECEIVAGGVGGYELPDRRMAGEESRGGYIRSSG